MYKNKEVNKNAKGVPVDSMYSNNVQSDYNTWFVVFY